MLQFEVVLFDMDGTLVEHSSLMTEAMQSIFLQVGCALELDVPAISGNTDYQNFKQFLRDHGKPEAELDQLVGILRERMIDKVVDLLSLQGLEACPGALSVVEDLSQMPVALGLLTGNFEGIVSPKLAAAGISPQYFSFGGYGDSCENRIEAARLALVRANQFLGRTLLPQKVLIIGDTPKDVACARAIGARVLTVTTGMFSRQDLAAYSPDFILEDLTDKEKVIALVRGERS